MFVNCPFCRGLVATDPVTDQPPERCPRCGAPLRESAGALAAVAVPPADATGPRDAGAGADDAVHVATGSTPQPVISIAHLLQPGSGSILPAAQPGVAVSASASVPTAGPVQAPKPAAAGADGPVPDAPAPTAGPIAAEPQTAGPIAAPAVPAPPVTAAGPPPGQAPDAPVRGRRAVPSFARARSPATGASTTGRRWPLPAAIAGLAALLALQWLLADRARLAADPAWRPVVAAACGLLRCSLPPWHEPGAFVLLERDVRPHPDAEGALRITASFRNDAAWAQPWPEVVLTLSDVDDRPLGARAFQPAEYLGSTPTAALVEAGQGAVIRMDVLEPGPGAVGFSFVFR